MFSIKAKLKPLIEMYRSKQPFPASVISTIEKKFRLDFSYNTNHIEGSTLTYDETELLILFGETKGQHSFREWQEMKAHDVAYKLVIAAASDKEFVLNETFIRELNRILLVEPYWKEMGTLEGQPSQREIVIGEYKKFPNSVRLENGEIFKYTDPMEVEYEIRQLIDWYRLAESENKISVVEMAAILHHRFVRIHPFDDGNGRVARLLTNFVLLKNDLPPVIVKSSDKRNYLLALRRADNGHVEVFVDYIASQLQSSIKMCIKAANGESIDEPGDVQRKLTQLKKTFGIPDDTTVQMIRGTDAINTCFERGILPLAEALETGLSNFDSLFFARRVFFSTSNNAKDGYSFVDTLNEFKSSIVDPILEIKSALGDVEIRCNFNRLRIGTSESNINGGHITINFHHHGYKINFHIINKSISKLYHEVMTQEEFEPYVSELGNWIFKNVEEQALQTTN